MTQKPNALRFMLPFSGVLAIVAAVAGYLLGGTTGAIGAAAGVVLITLLFVLSTIGITWVESFNRAMMMVAALTAYSLKLIILVAVFNAVASSGWSGLHGLVWGVAAGVIGWISGYAWWLWHAKIPYVDV